MPRANSCQELNEESKAEINLAFVACTHVAQMRPKGLYPRVLVIAVGPGLVACACACAHGFPETETSIASRGASGAKSRIGSRLAERRICYGTVQHCSSIR